MNEPRLNLPELTVSELSTALKRTIEDAYGYVRVRGELGKVSYHGNGHVYFDLKDDRASIAGVIWRTTAPRIRIKLEAGLAVVITGKLLDVSGWVFQISRPVRASMAINHPVGPEATYWVPMNRTPSTIVGAVRDTVPAATP